MTEPVSLICPKCGADMRAYERSGVTVDQCTGCRGVFLDRGELERLVDAEGSYYARSAASPPPMPQGRPDERYGYGPAGHHGGSGGHEGRRRRGFLGELFD